MRAFARDCHFYIVSVLEDYLLSMHLAKFYLEWLDLYLRHRLHYYLQQIGHLAQGVADQTQENLLLLGL
jgi:hypothetical protein